MASSGGGKGSSPLDDFVWTVRTNPKTGKPYLCVSTPGNAPAGATLYVPKPAPPPASRSSLISIKPTSPSLSASAAPASPRFVPLASPKSSSSRASFTSLSASSASASSKSPLLSPSKAAPVRVAPPPPPREDDEPPPPPDDDDDDDILYCEVCEDDERHAASHRCLVCELDVCRKKSALHVADPIHKLVSLGDLRDQDLAKYRELFASPGFDPAKKYVEVLWNDPGAVEDNELPLTKGEFIEVNSEKNETPEWWYGCKVANRSVSGLFPSNYVTVLNVPRLKALVNLPAPSSSSSSSMRVQKPSSPAPSSYSSASASMIVSSKSPHKSSSSSSSANALLSSHKPADTETKAERCKLSVVAIQEFKQATGTYLSFAKGERLTITKQKSDKWWWGVNSKGAKGWVPANHVHVLPIEGS